MAAETSVQEPTIFEQVTVSLTEEKEFIWDPYLFALSGSNLQQYCTMLSCLDQQNPKPEVFWKTSQGMSVPLSLVQVVEEFEVLPYSYRDGHKRTMQAKSHEPPLPGSSRNLVHLRYNFMPNFTRGVLRRKPSSCSAASKLQQEVETKSPEFASPEENLSLSPELLKADQDREGQTGALNATVLQQEDSRQPPATYFIVTEQSKEIAPEGFEQSTSREEGRSDLLPGDNSGRRNCGSDHHLGEAFLHTGDRSHPSDDIGKCFNEPLSLSVRKGVVSQACPACGKIFNLNRNPFTHPLTPSDQKSFKCPQCGHSLHGSTAGPARHQRIPANEQDRQLSCRQNQKASKIEMPFKCPACGRGFKYKSSLTRHQKLHHKENASPVSERFSQGPKPFMPEKTYADQKSFQRHKVRTVWINGSAKKVSNRCDPPTSALSSPCREISTQPPKFQKDLTSTKKPFGCSECRKSFTVKASLVRHQLLHQGARPFKCPYCDKGYIQKSHLDRHSQKKHRSGLVQRESL
ncbi:uncharacterized protein LOC140704072 [Pogona vitticeps]